MQESLVGFKRVNVKSSDLDSFGEDDGCMKLRKVRFNRIRNFGRYRQLTDSKVIN